MCVWGMCAYTHKKNAGYSHKESQIHVAHNLTEKVKVFLVLFFYHCFLNGAIPTRVKFNAEVYSISVDVIYIVLCR